MATGTFGNIRPADIDPSKDAESFYTYIKDRTVSPSQVFRLNPSEILFKLDHPEQTNRILGGLYNLRLPTTTFNQLGIYTVYIRPKEIKLQILDCGVLASKPDIKGIIIDLNTVSPEDLFRFENNGLIGYRIEYLNTNANVSEIKVQNLYRIVTSNFRVEPISDNMTSTTQKSIKYRINDNSTLVFCTLTPSTAFNLRPNVYPFIGNPSQEIIFSNTFFDPISMEIELVEHDIETLAIGIFGNQAKNIKNGTRTYYDSDDQIYKQYNEYVIKDTYNNESLYEVKLERDQIDFTQELSNITG
jgi:hypothetical protein